MLTIWFVDNISHACRIYELFTLYVHHGGYFDVNPQKYVGGEVGVVDDCDPDKWSKVEMECIYREFGYTLVSTLWYRRPGDYEKDGVFQLIMDDHDAVAMTKLVRGHGEIHVYVEHPVYEPMLINGGNGVPVDIVVEPDHDDPCFVSDSENCNSSELECSFDGCYNGQGYYASSGDNFEDDDDWDDGNDDWGDGDAHWDYGNDNQGDGDAHWDGGSAIGRDGGRAGDEFGSGGARDTSDKNDDSDNEVEILGCRRPGKEPIVEEPQQDGVVTTNSNDGFEDRDVEKARSMNPNQRYVGKGSASSDSEEMMHMYDQMEDGVMNSDYTIEELLSLNESLFDGEFQGDGDDGSDSKGGATVNKTVVNNVRRRRKKFLGFILVSNPKHLVFEKHMLFTLVKQFKEAIIEYVVKGG